jgi:hypothetical protein
LVSAALALVGVAPGLVGVVVHHGYTAPVLNGRDVTRVATQPAFSTTPDHPTVPLRSGAWPPAPAAEVTARLRRLLARRPATEVSIAALDLTDASRYQYPTDRVIRTASVVKLDILEALLLQHQHSGQPLDDLETAKATAMIEHSDNDATDALWDTIGGAHGLRAANRQLGAKRTTPDADRYWALATSNASDQLTLLRNLVDDHPLHAESRTFARGILEKVNPTQAWGVSTAADPGTAPALNNGSLNADDDNGRWAVGSVGMITVRGHQVLLAVLTQHNPSEQEGINLVQDLAATTVAAVAHPKSPTVR